MPLTERIANLVPRSDVRITGRERDMILEIAYLAIAADRTLRDEEIAAFGAVANRLRALVTPPKVDADLLAKERRVPRIREVEHVAVFDEEIVDGQHVAGPQRRNV